MIELEHLTENEKLKISVQCEPVFLVYKEQKVFKNIFNQLSKELSKKYHKELWLVLTCILKALRYGGTGTRISLNKNHYTYANKVHNQKLYQPRVKFVLEHLDSNGFILFYKGYKNNETDKMTSCIFPTDKFLSYVDMDKVRKFAAKRDPLDFIEIKDKVGKKTVMLSLRDFRGYSVFSKQLESYNTLLSQTLIEMLTEDGSYVKCNLSYKRVFFQGFDQAGRFYSSGKFQTNKSELRKYLKIKGCFTTEVDFCNLHPRLLYTLEGIALEDDWDAYELKDFDCERSFIKKAYLSILFSDSYDQAVKSVLNTANTLKLKVMQNKISCSKLVDCIMDKNSKIKHYFFQEQLWAKLQHLDSRLASYIIYKFTDLKEVCLGWHDSFVVTKNNQKILIDIMKESWFNIFGSYMNFKVDIEY